jgi:glucose/arabinose dehydrogenase
MRPSLTGLAIAILACMVASGCGDNRPVHGGGFGPTPHLPEPDTSLIPTVNAAEVVGWKDGAKPTAASGTSVAAFARDLDHPRWLYVLPNGDVLVAEANAPAKKPEDDQGGIKAALMKRQKEKSGSGNPSANRITLLRDHGGDGVVDTRTAFLTGLNSPFGMALVGDVLYVACADALMRFAYVKDATAITTPGVKVIDLPTNPPNHHWTRSLIASPDGTRLYIGVGSNSNIGEHGMDKEEGRAAIWEVDPRTGAHRLFATGLRNPVGLAWEPTTGVLWTAVNERDELGNDLVPDYLTSVQDGGFYGWPYSYFGQHLDPRPQPQRPDLVAKAIVPDYALGSHTSSLGLAWSGGTMLPAAYRSGMFVGQHGSWNRVPASGYAVLFIPFSNGKPAGMPLTLLSGFLAPGGKEAYGRPVGVALDARGALLVADDAGNVVWRVTAAETAQR